MSTKNKPKAETENLLHFLEGLQKTTVAVFGLVFRQFLILTLLVTSLQKLKHICVFFWKLGLLTFTHSKI